jgi:hypothetical protein
VAKEAEDERFVWASPSRRGCQYEKSSPESKAEAEVEGIIAAARTGGGQARELEELTPTPEALAAEDLAQDIKLKRMYARGDMKWDKSG